MINYNIGDPFQIPRKKACGHMGRIVWVSKDGNSIAVQCDKLHSKDPFTGTRYFGIEHHSYKNKDTVSVKKRPIYIIDVSMDKPTS